MSGFVVDFEVLPPDTPGQPSASEVVSGIQRQLHSRSGGLFHGDMARMFHSASMADDLGRASGSSSHHGAVTQPHYDAHGHSRGPPSSHGSPGVHQAKIDAMERELHEIQESQRSDFARAQRAEMMLKDREQLLIHAKEMWMKESARASKLADALSAVQDRLTDQEKRLHNLNNRYNDAVQEVRQLKPLIDGPNAGGYGMPIGAPGSGGMVPGSSGLVPAMPPPPSSVDTNTERFRQLCMANDAVLWEDEMLEVGVKAEFSGLEGQIAVYFGNKGNAALQAFSVQYFVNEDHALKLSASSINHQLDPMKQVVQRLHARLVAPFMEAPSMRIQYLLPDASPQKINIKFPLLLTKFMRGRELSQHEFFRLWRDHNFVLNEVTSVASLAPQLRSALVHVARTLVIGGALRIHHGFDSNPDNFVLVGQLSGTLPTSTAAEADYYSGMMSGSAGAGGDYQQADAPTGLSLVRVEIGAGRFTGKARIAVRSNDHLVARGLCECILMRIAEGAHA